MCKLFPVGLNLIDAKKGKANVKDADFDTRRIS